MKLEISRNKPKGLRENDLKEEIRKWLDPQALSLLAVLVQKY
jgi:hypothetical protein